MNPDKTAWQEPGQIIEGGNYNCDIQYVRKQTYISMKKLKTIKKQKLLQIVVKHMLTLQKGYRKKVTKLTEKILKILTSLKKTICTSVTFRCSRGNDREILINNNKQEF